MSTEDMSGWTIDPNEFTNIADRKRDEQCVEAIADVDGITLNINEGSGYLSQSVSTFIPTRVVIAMLERVGYVVSDPIGIERINARKKAKAV